MTKVIRTTNEETLEQSAPVRKSASFFGRFLFALLVGTGVAFFFLPSIAGWLCESPQAVAWVSGQPEGTLAIGDASFSWQGPVRLSNVVLKTPEGHPVANVETVTYQKTFWNLLTQIPEPIKLQLDGIKLTTQVPQPGTPEGDLNLAELTNAVQSFKIPAPAQAMDVTITNCSIQFENGNREPVAVWSNISANYKYEVNNQQSQIVSVSMPMAENSLHGAFTLQAAWTKDTTPEQNETCNLQGSTDQLSLSVVDPWLQKYLGTNHELKTCTGNLQGVFQRDAQSGWEISAAAKLDNALPGSPLPAQMPVSLQAQGGLELEVHGKFSKPDDELTVHRLYLAADNAAVDLKGSVKEISGSQVLNVTAEVQTPGSALMDMLPAEVRERIQIEGMKFSQITINGSLLPGADGSAPSLAYSLLASWDAARAYGLESRQGQLRVSYRDGQVFAEPVNVPISGGRLVSLPVLDLRTEPSILRFSSGPVLDNVQLTEEVCRDWLKYVSPTLANATSADGRLFLNMNAGEIPLGQMEQARLNGVLAIRDGRVRPGPLAIQILQQVSAIQQMVNRGGEDLTQKAFLTMPQEETRFALQEGRVYHENFGANVGEMRITTAGSVGLDQSLAMQLQIMLPQKWLANERPVLQALAGQGIKLGISGTMDQPRIDASNMADFGKQIGIKAGVNLLEKIIERRQERNR